MEVVNIYLVEFKFFILNLISKTPILFKIPPIPSSYPENLATISPIAIRKRRTNKRSILTNKEFNLICFRRHFNVSYGRLENLKAKHKRTA